MLGTVSVILNQLYGMLPIVLVYVDCEGLYLAMHAISFPSMPIGNCIFSVMIYDKSYLVSRK